jgi:hypothetical protein
MIPEPIFLSLSRVTTFLPRLMMQIAASALLTAFYTPGGAAGWILDLVLRGTFAISRGLQLRVALPAPTPVLVRTGGQALRIGQGSSRTEQFSG